MQNIYITMIYIMRCYILCGVIYYAVLYIMRCYIWIINSSLRSTRHKECNSLRIPPNLNETSVRGNIHHYKILPVYYIIFLY
jgi:hypothetical protein